MRKERGECWLLVPGVPEAPSGGAEGGEKEIVGGLAETEGELKSGFNAKPITTISMFRS